LLTMITVISTQFNFISLKNFIDQHIKIYIHNTIKTFFVNTAIIESTTD